MGGTKVRVAALVLLALTMLRAPQAEASPPLPVGALEVTAADVGLDWIAEGDDWLRFCRVPGGGLATTCTAPQRDLRQVALSFAYLPQALALAADVETGSCDQAVRRVFGMYYDIEKIAADYRRRANLSGGWASKVTGDDYRKTSPHALLDLRACLLDAGDRCGSSLLLTPDMRTVLKLGVVDGRCVAQKTAMPPHILKDDPAVARRGIVGAQTALPPPTAVQRSLVLAAVAAHQRGTGVQAAIRALVASATTLEQQYLFALPLFFGGNGGWSAADDTAWDALEHVKFVAWADAVLGNRFADAQMFLIDHQQTHFCENIGPHQPVDVRLSVAGKKSGAWPYATCDDVIALFRASIEERPTPTRTVTPVRATATPVPGQTAQPTAVATPVGGVTLWRCYVDLVAGGAINVPLRSGDPPLEVAIPAADLAAFPVGQRKTVTPAAAPIFDAAVQAYVAAHPDDYPSDATVDTVRTAQRVQ